MRFLERKTAGVYEYETGDERGTIKLTSPRQLPPDELDSIVAASIQSKQATGFINSVSFAYVTTGSWED